jgi:hypothetical protein
MSKDSVNHRPSEGSRGHPSGSRPDRRAEASCKGAPGGDGAGGDLDQDLAGTWTLSGDTVTFNPTGASVIQGAQFTAARDQLTGEGTFGDQTLRLVLTKD